jgi:hypothetical protein
MIITPDDASRMKGDEQMLSVESLAELTGFSSELIKDEILSGHDLNDGQISLGELRVAMTKYLGDLSLVDE